MHPMCFCIEVKLSAFVDLWPSWPGLNISEQRITRASCCDVLTMAKKSVSGCETSPVTRADNESLCSAQSYCWWKNSVELSKEAESNWTRVEPWRMGASAIPSTTFINDSSVTNAEVITNISPSVWVHVEVLNVSHLCVTKCLRVASSTISMMDNWTFQKSKNNKNKTN